MHFKENVDVRMHSANADVSVTVNCSTYLFIIHLIIFSFQSALHIVIFGAFKNITEQLKTRILNNYVYA